MLIDLPTAKLHLRVIADIADIAPHPEDSLITLYIGAAEQSASDFLGRSIYADEAAQGDDADGIVVNDAIKAAILLTVGHLYANREDVVTGVTVSQLPMGAGALLQPHRIGMGV